MSSWPVDLVTSVPSNPFSIPLVDTLRGGAIGGKGLCGMFDIWLSSCVRIERKCALSNCALRLGVVIYVVLFRGCNCVSVLPAHPKRSEKFSLVVYMVVSETFSYLFAFRDSNVFGKCLLVVHLCRPVFWCSVWLRASRVLISCGVICVSGKPG